MSKEAKLAEFSQYNFDADPKWSTYLNNIELPAGDPVTLLTRLKAKWYKKTRDADFDSDWVSTANMPAKAPGTARASTFSSGGGASTTPPPPSSTYPSPPPDTRTASTPSQPSAPTSTHTSSATSASFPAWVPAWVTTAYERASAKVSSMTGGSGSSSGNGRSPATGVFSKPALQRTTFYLQLAAILLGVLQLVPFFPYSRHAYVYFMRTAVVAQVLTLYTRFGLPQFQPLERAMTWVQQVTPSNDAYLLIVLFSFMMNQPISLVPIPTIIWYAYSVTAYIAAQPELSRSMLWQRFGKPLHKMLLDKQQSIALGSAGAEVALLFLLVAQLVTPRRHIMQLFFYANMLKMRYHTPGSAGNHRQVWQIIDERTARMRQNFPMLNTPLGYIQNWFTTVRR